MEQASAQRELMEFDFEDAKYVQAHRHSEIELLYVLDGAVLLSVADEAYRLQKDDVVVINSGEKHAYRAQEPVLIGVVHMHFTQVNAYLDLHNYRFQCNSAVDKNEAYQEIRKILDRIFHLYYEKEQEKAYLNSLYFYLLHRLIGSFTVHNKKTVPSGQTAEERAQEILLYIQDNFRFPVSLGEMAEHFHLSEAYLSKYIKKALGMNLRDALNQVRLANAVEEMRLHRKPLTRIALDNGFASAAAFTQAFKNEYGEPPSAWKTAHMKEIAQEEKKRKKRLQKKGARIQEYLERHRDQKAAAPAPAGHVLEVDAEKGKPYQKNWNRLINIGPMEALLRSDIQEHLLLLKKELGFSYVRFWNLFSDEMLVEVQGPGGIQNFSRLDKVFDFLIENRMHPFIELGFKPVLLMKSLDRTIVSQEREISFSSKEQFGEMLYRVLAHCVNRYGINEVNRWYFEQWGDPRITEGEDFGEYFGVFETAYHTIKSISSQISVGGAGFGRLYTTMEFKEILSLWKQRVSHPDFISLYSYPYMARSKGKSLNEDRIQDPNFVRNQILMMKEVQQEVAMTVPQLLVTEWSSSVSNWNRLNDSLHKGSFLLKTILDNLEDAEMLGYWMATDLLAEYYDTGTLLHGGNGLLSVDGIKKPAFYAFQFAQKAGELLLGRGEHSLITTNNRNSFVIVCHHYRKPNYKYFLKKEDEIEAEKQFLLFDEAEPLPLRFRIRNVKNGKYLVKIRSLDSEHGSVQDAWARMGYSEHLNRQDIEYLRDISTPQIFIQELEVKNHLLEIKAVLKPHEIRAIHILFQIE